VSQSSGAAPAGWYPIEEGSTQLRYWNGASWTDYLHDPATPATVAAVVPRQPLRAPGGTSPNTPWGWVIAFWPILSLVSLIPTISYLQGLVDTDYTSPDAVTAAILSPDYFVTAAIGVVAYGLFVLISALDYRALAKASVPQPFHWAWSFLSGFVYVIGRGVVVKRRTGRGLAPMWIFISLEIAIFIVTSIVSIIFAIEITSEISGLALTQAGNAL
jgi:hypothetical protein